MTQARFQFRLDTTQLLSRFCREQSQKEASSTKRRIQFSLARLDERLQIRQGNCPPKKPAFASLCDKTMAYPAPPTSYLPMAFTNGSCSGSRSLRVLIGENSEFAETVALVLSFEGYAVVVARKGVKFWRIAEDVRPDIAVLELGPSIKDGLNTARLIRHSGWGASTHLIALCSVGDLASVAKARAFGFDNHFVKPVDPSKLVCQIDAWRRKRTTLRHANNPSHEPA